MNSSSLYYCCKEYFTTDPFAQAVLYMSQMHQKYECTAFILNHNCNISAVNLILLIFLTCFPSYPPSHFESLLWSLSQLICGHSRYQQSNFKFPLHNTPRLANFGFDIRRSSLHLEEKLARIQESEKDKRPFEVSRNSLL